MDFSILLSIKWYDLFLLSEIKQGRCPMSRRRQLSVAAGMIGISLLACTPIITIGYGEILILALIFILFVGPVFYRFFRTRKGSDRENGDKEND
jgi:hypothetical protein